MAARRLVDRGLLPGLALAYACDIDVLGRTEGLATELAGGASIAARVSETYLYR